MKVDSIQVINFGNDLKSADIIIKTDELESYIAKIHQLDFLQQKILHGKLINSKTNYFYLPDSIVVDEINEDQIFDLVNNLLDEGDFYSVFKKI